MPELPEVETVRGQLAPHLEGRRIVQASVLDPRWCAPAPPEETEDAVGGRLVESVDRRGKYLTLALEDEVRRGKLKTEADLKRALRIRISSMLAGPENPGAIARAEPGHASQPWPEAATHRLVRAAHALLTQPPEDRECPPVAEMVRRLGSRSRAEIAAARATAPLLHDTLSLTLLSGGYKINVIPEQAEMSFDCRLLPDTDERSFVSNLEQLVNDPGIRLEVEWPDSPQATAPWDGEMFAAIEQACLAHAPSTMVTPSICVGGTDGRFFRERDIPTYGLVPCLFTGEDMKGYHGIDERLSIENLGLGSRIIYDLVCRVAAKS